MSTDYHDTPAGFGAEFALGAAGANAAPAMATLDDGRRVLAWQADDGSVRYRIGDKVSGIAGAASDPALAALAQGGFVLAYAKGDGVAWRIVHADGSAGPEQRANAGSHAHAAMPDVALLADGSFALAWRADGQVAVRRFDAGGAPLGAVETFAVMGSAYSPQVVAHGAGYAVSWGEIGDGNIYLASTGAPLPGMTALNDGGFVIAWDSYVNNPVGFASSDIFFQRYDGAGTAVGAITQANTDMRVDGRFDAQVTALADGGFVLAWQADDLDGNGIFGRRYDAHGNPIDAREFAISALRQGDQASPVLGGMADGGFATAWRDTQADGSAAIEARVLAGAAPEALALSHDIDGAAGQAYRLYAAAFDRAPDAVGLGYWIAAMERGVSLATVASGFSGSQEFIDLYGAHTSDAHYVGLLYQNTLHRAPDAQGQQFWIDAMQVHHARREDVLVYFSESEENQAQVMAAIADGIAFVPWG